MTPTQLDAFINGVAVYIYRRPDGVLWATTHDWSYVGSKPVEMIRVPQPLDKSIIGWTPTNNGIVRARLAELRLQELGNFETPVTASWAWRFAMTLSIISLLTTILFGVPHAPGWHVLRLLQGVLS